MSMDNYVPIAVRMKKFREDNAKKKIYIKKEVIVSWEKEAAYVKATIYLDDVVVAEAHAMAPVLGEDKEFEKAETAAVGRALVDLGYESDDGEAEESSGKKSKSKNSKKSGGLGGGKKASKKKDEEEDDDSDEEEEEDDDSEDEEEEESEDEEEEESEDDDDEEEDDDDDDDSEEEEEEDDSEKEKSKKSSGGSPSAKLNGVMAKYGLKKDK